MVLDRSRQTHNCLLCCYSSLRQTCCRPNIYITQPASVQSINSIRKNRPLTSPDVPRMELKLLMGHFHVSEQLWQKPSDYPIFLVQVLSALLRLSSLKSSLYKRLLDGLNVVVQRESHPGQTTCEEQSPTSPTGSLGISGHG